MMVAPTPGATSPGDVTISPAGAPAGRCAVVIGSGPAGLLAAVALRQSFEQVCVVHRSTHPASSTASFSDTTCDAVALLLLAPGCEALEEILPGVVEDFLAAGAVSFEAGAGFRWSSQGLQVGGTPSGLETVSASRHLVRSVLARRLASLGGIRWISRAEVVDLDLEERKQQVRGVFYRRLDGTNETEWQGAQLVVDASGRSENSGRWLQRLGFGRPSARTWGSERLGFVASFQWPGGFGEPRYTWLIEEGSISATLRPIEEGRWIAMMSRPVTEPISRAPVVSDFTSFCEALGPVQERSFSVPHWRREPSAGPGGFLSFGDAQISFDPVFDVGLTMAARSAALLAAHLREDPLLARARRWRRRLHPVLRRAWRVQRWRRRGVEPRLDGTPYRASASRQVEARLLRVLNLAESPRRLEIPLLWQGFVPRRLLG